MKAEHQFLELEDSRLCVEGKNCCAIARADRAAVLIDGAAYFSVLAEALKRAQRFVFISGWQLDSRVRLNPADPNCPPFGDFLHELVRYNRKLRVYALVWDYAMIFAADREIIPLYGHPWRSHRRIHFRLDGNHPLGASHHQKIVVIDDALAFAGGLDIAEKRWDTSEHRPDDSRRVDSSNRPYPAYHDVQLMVDGDAAAALGQVARERWRRAIRKTIRTPPGRVNDPWPPEVMPDFNEVSVAISRTEPEWDGRPQVKEVEALYLDSIRAARNLIYFENQYLTSPVIGNAIAARLQDAEGPEVVMVLPRETSEWVEQITAVALRSRLLKRLRAEDRFGRFHVYYPFVPGDGKDVRIHAKLCFIDDRLMRIGSANLTNRSMGLDTECDLAIEARNGATQKAIAHQRNRLLAEHLGATPERVAEQHAAEGSLTRAIEKLRGAGRALHMLDGTAPKWLDDMIPEARVVDPERPVRPELLIEELVPGGTRRRAIPGFLRLAVLFACLAALSLIWRSTPLVNVLDPRDLSGWAAFINNAPFAPLWVVGGYTLGGLVLVPVTLLIVVTGATFGPGLGFFYSVFGALVSALVTYALGRIAGRDLVRRIAGSRLGYLQYQISRHGFVSMLFARVVPVAPFAVVNMAAGAAQIRLRDFVLGTLVGMTPGILGIVLLADRLEAVLRDPSIQTASLLFTLAIFFALVALAFGRWYSPKRWRESLQHHLNSAR